MAKYDALFRHLCTVGDDPVEMTLDEIEQLVGRLRQPPPRRNGLVEQRPHRHPSVPHSSLARRRPTGPPSETASSAARWRRSS